MADDKTLKCKDCGQSFVFTAGEQDFYAQKGFQNEPVRCPACRQARKRERTSMDGVHFRNRESDGASPSHTNYDKNRY